MRKAMRAGVSFALVAALGMAVFSGCAPRRKLVNLISSREGQIKLGYVDTLTEGQGIIKCAVGDDGSLSECRELMVSFAE